jgi:hypothetical protein
LRTCALSSKKVRSRQLQHNSHDPAAAVSQHHRASHPIWLPRAFDPSFDVSIIVSISARPGLGATCLSLTFRHAGGGTMGHGTCNMQHGAHISCKGSIASAVLHAETHCLLTLRITASALPSSPSCRFVLQRAIRNTMPRERAIWMFFGERKASRHSNRKFCFCIAGLPLASSTASRWLACLLF